LVGKKEGRKERRQAGRPKELFNSWLKNILKKHNTKY
jgi:hypothetical protein